MSSSSLPTAPAFTARDVAVAYDGKPVLRDVSFEIARGETVAVMGPNGSGKSTLVRALLGVVPLSGGQVWIGGTPLRRFRDWAQIGYVPQRLSVGGGVPATVREIVASGRINRRRRFRPLTAHDRDAVTEALTAVGLLDRADAGEPDIFVMDEPMAGVDAANQQALARTIESLAARGATILLVLHELGPLEPLIGRALTLENGTLVSDGAPQHSDHGCCSGRDHSRTDTGRPPPTLPYIEVSRRA